MRDSAAAVLTTMLRPLFGARSLRPEKLFTLAILSDAIDAYLDAPCVRSVGRRSTGNEIERWFAAHDPAWPFSFVSVCELLDLDAGAIRGLLARCRSEGGRVETWRAHGALPMD